ncbi:hypothetical protein Scep_012786 [Stephania cephalantha]|uniref:Uncharacterized protein n=1 Tax=Stephania cephalantha TaxID=152367 RepID=A0AAP0JFR5_9MAGN
MVQMWQSHNNETVEQRISESTRRTSRGVILHGQVNIKERIGYGVQKRIWCGCAVVATVDRIWCATMCSGGCASGGVVAQATRSSGLGVDADGADGAKARCSGNDAGDQQDATSVNSSDFGEPPTRTTSSSDGPDLETAAAGGGAGGWAGGRLADGLQADTRQHADGGDRRVQRTIA